MPQQRLPPSLFVSSNVRTLNVDLARVLGVNEALMLQQIYYWLERSSHYHDGRVWVYNTYDAWQEQFPFWSRATIRRVIASLEESKCVLSANYNAMKIDNTKWYTIDFGQVERLVRDAKLSSPPAQSAADHMPKVSTPITKDYTHKITTSLEEVMATLFILFPAHGDREATAKAYIERGATPREIVRKAERLKAAWEGKPYQVTPRSLLNNWAKVDGSPAIDDDDYWEGANYE